jgi:hypothetical protein
MNRFIISIVFASILSACGGGGSDSATTSAEVTTPVAVFSSSYENTHSIINDNPKLPGVNEVSGILLEDGENNFGMNSVAFADFKRNGSLQALATTTVYKNVYAGDNPNKYADSPAKIHFLEKQNSKWVDITSSMLSGSQTVCVTPGSPSVSDFNNDGKPDAFFSCMGPDFTIAGQYQDTSYQYVLLSNPTGKYEVSKVSAVDKIYAHETTAIDINNDGNVDVIATDPKTYQKPIVLFGNGDGTFYVDANKFPADMYTKEIYGLRAFKNNNNVYVVASGPTPYSRTLSDEISTYGTKMLKWDATLAKFEYVADFTSVIPNSANSNLKYLFALDTIFFNNSLYMLFVNKDYSAHAYIKIAFDINDSTKPVSALILKETVRSNGEADTSGVMKLTSNNTITQQMSLCSAEAYVSGNWLYNQCTLSVNVN